MNSRFLVPAALLLGDLTAVPAANDASKPNVLFIFIDDLRPSLGFYGDPLAKSPNIDQLTQSARVFNRAYTQQRVNTASTASKTNGQKKNL